MRPLLVTLGIVALALAALLLGRPRGGESVGVQPPASPERAAALEPRPARAAPPEPAREGLAREEGLGAQVEPAGSAVLQGAVEDPRGEPVQGVRVRADAGERAATTDEHGRFELEEPGTWTQLDADKPGWVQVSWPAPRAVGQGEDVVRIVMAPRATLTVSVIDPAGGPVSGVDVEAVLSAAEPHGSSRTPMHGTPHVASRARTGADGRARLEGAPAGQRLRVQVTLASDTRSPLRLAPREQIDAQGVLRATRTGSTTPLVLVPGEEREVRVELVARIRLAGRVTCADGDPASTASVRLRELAGEADGQSLWRSATCDEEGAFELDALLDRAPGTLWLCVEVGKPGGLFQRAGPPVCGDLQQGAWLLLDPTPQGIQAEHLAIRLAIHPAIAGRVLDARGEAVGSARVTLYPTESVLGVDRLLSGSARHVDTAGEGTFELRRVPAGLYDVHVGSPSGAERWVRGVAAGTEDLLVVLEDAEPARVVISVGGELEWTQIIVLFTKLSPRDPELDAPRLPSSARYDEPRGWPAEALGLWYGAEGYTGALGEATFSSWPIRGTTHSREVVPGLYWIGAKAVAGTVRAHPIGTGLVRVGPGVHHLEFHLEPTAGLYGRVRGVEPGSDLRVALATQGGELIPLDVRRGSLVTMGEIGAFGAFDLGHVPAGRPLELRVGTPEELLSGRARLTQRVTLSAGEGRELVLGP